MSLLQTWQQEEQKPYRYLLGILILSNLLDLATTYEIIVERSGYEANPLPATILSLFGWPAFYFIKFIHVLLAFGITTIIIKKPNINNKHKKIFAFIVLWGLILPVWYACIHNIVNLWLYG